MIYLAGVYFYSIWITINCDSWSKKLFDLYDLEQRGDVEEEEEEEEYYEEDEGENAEENEEELNEEETDEMEEEEEIAEDNGEDDIIPGGKNMKYYILIMAGVNHVVNILFEWVAMRLINYCYENRQIERFKREIENEKMLKQNGKVDGTEIKDVPIYKYQRVYYYDRRKRMNL